MGQIYTLDENEMDSCVHKQVQEWTHTGAMFANVMLSVVHGLKLTCEFD